MSEFYDKPADDLGDPATDQPLTMRVHPDDDPHDPAARRAVKSDEGDGMSWWLITGHGRGEYGGYEVGDYYDDTMVADWPYTNMLVASAAFSPVDEHRTFTFNGDDGATCICGEQGRDILTRTGAGIWHQRHRGAVGQATERGDGDVEWFKGGTS